ncbi:hypothetical protein BDN67DRAFT_965498 [Paxillus ammoniavirescens]|nr:hypothetical protein BDN67DRAFT_965498 [Paxillus ammoniavirescens]
MRPRRVRSCFVQSSPVDLSKLHPSISIGVSEQVFIQLRGTEGVPTLVDDRSDAAQQLECVQAARNPSSDHTVPTSPPQPGGPVTSGSQLE